MRHPTAPRRLRLLAAAAAVSVLVLTGCAGANSSPQSSSADVSASAGLLADQGLEDAPVEIDVDCGGFADCHSGTAVITVRVDSRVELPLMPDVLGGGAPSFALASSHTVPIGQYQEITR